jgi:hypothetical protein
VLRYQHGLFLPEAGTSSIDAAARSQAVDGAFLAELTKLVDQGQPMSPSVPSQNYAPRKISKTVRGFRLNELEKAQQRLLDAGRIHIRDEGKPSRPTRCLYPGPKPKPDEAPGA